MNTTFLWTGFICLMLIALVVTFYAIVYVVDLAFRKTKMINGVFKVITDFYRTFPKKKKDIRYVITLYDYKERKFIDSAHLNEYGETDEEHQNYWDEMKKKHARVRD